jgi:hypothetical protein
VHVAEEHGHEPARSQEEKPKSPGWWCETRAFRGSRGAHDAGSCAVDRGDPRALCGTGLGSLSTMR